jgi:hypothetical protein
LGQGLFPLDVASVFNHFSHFSHESPLQVRRLLEVSLLEEVVCLHTRILLSLSAHAPLPLPPAAFYTDPEEKPEGGCGLGRLLLGGGDWSHGWAAPDAARAAEFVAGHTIGNCVAQVRCCRDRCFPTGDLGYRGSGARREIQVHGISTTLLS